MRRKHLIAKIRAAFDCQRCDLCCKVPGFVFLTNKDVRKIAPHFKLSEDKFRSKYCEQNKTGNWILKSQADGACIFLEDSGCSIHQVKPQQCRDFPMKWRDSDAYEYCEGILKINKQDRN